ncbi:hypothetical protein DsansV1_C44g0240591 [Dioscorea sansibarensis]
MVILQETKRNSQDFGSKRIDLNRPHKHLVISVLIINLIHGIKMRLHCTNVELSELCHGCSTDLRSWQEYGGEVHEGKCEAVSMLDQEIGICSVCHTLLVSQISFQIFPGTQERPNLQMKEPPLQQQLSLLEHPFQWHSWHTAET